MVEPRRCWIPERRTVVSPDAEVRACTEDCYARAMTSASTTTVSHIWNRVVCGIDGTLASLHAAKQADLLMPAAAQLTLCAVAEASDAEHGRVRQETQESLDLARAEVSPTRTVELHLREGSPVETLLGELVTEAATLIVVGSHGQTRPAGIRHGSVATAMLHKAPCAVLVVRGHGLDEAPDGRAIVVAFDGSPAARRAFAIAHELSERLELKSRLVVATGGPMIAPELPWLAEQVGPETQVVEDPRGVTDALVDASASAPLLVIGGRHLHGISALWSVSERAGHAATCPVLVV